MDPIFRHLFQHSAVLLWIFFFLIPLRVMSISDSVQQVLCENRKAMNSFDFCFSNACLFSQQIALAIYKKLHSLCHWPFVTSLLEKCLIICLNVFCNLLFICHLSFSYHIFLSHVKLEIIHIFIYVSWAFLSLILLFAFGVGSVGISDVFMIWCSTLNAKSLIALALPYFCLNF